MTRWWKCDLQVATPGNRASTVVPRHGISGSKGGERLPPTTTCEPSWQQEWR